MAKSESTGCPARARSRTSPRLPCPSWAAGPRLDTFVTPDGLKRDWTTARVDNSRISSTFDTEVTGRRKPGLGTTIIRQDGSDAIYALLSYRAEGFLVVRDNIDAPTAYQAGQTVEVYPAQCDERSKMYGPNTLQRADVPMAVRTEPDINAVVAA